MTNLKERRVRALLSRVFERTLSNEDFLNEVSNIVDINDGDEYPKFVWKADHYLTDLDLCANDCEYEAMMKEDILALCDAYFENPIGK